MKYEQASAYVLGLDLGELANDAERQAVESFVARVRSERDPLATQARMAWLGPPSWNRDPDELLARIEAFDVGFEGERS